MSPVCKFYPEVRLKKIVAEAGGLTAADAIDRAQRSLEEIRDDCLAAVDKKIDAIAALATTEVNASLERVYQLANEIFAEAGTFGLNELSAVAHNLCNVVSAPPGRRPLGEVVRVHTDAMRALRAPAMASDQALRGAVLTELRNLGARLSGSDGT